jgi:hypothetical protein
MSTGGRRSTQSHPQPLRHPLQAHHPRLRHHRLPPQGEEHLKGASQENTNFSIDHESFRLLNRLWVLEFVSVLL